MFYHINNRIIKRCFTFLLMTLIFSQSVFLSYAEESSDLTYEEQALQRQSLPIESNDIENWPVGPSISAEAAVLMEADTGTILYAKNEDEQLYPASTTKMLTCLIAAESCSMDEMVTFSSNAINSVPSDGSTIGVNVGESLSMQECLYAILVASANEVATAVGEHVAGSVDAFTDLMNEKAKELGCTGSHFSNCNGLFLEDHYTTAHDLALIARAFFDNDILYRIGNTPTHHFVASDTQPDDFYKTNKHKLITGEISYDGIIGGKTGFTDEARQTLVTGCEQNGMRLICVVLKEESPTQFTDTVSLFDYGFQNFTKVNVADNDTTYCGDGTNFFKTGSDLFSQTSPIFYVDSDDYVVLPNMASFSDLTSTITYDTTNSDNDQIADITYQYYGANVGDAAILVSDSSDTDTTSDLLLSSSSDTLFINVKILLLYIVGIAIFFIIIMLLNAMLNSRRDLTHERKRWHRLKRDQRITRKKNKRDRRLRMKRRRK